MDTKEKSGKGRRADNPNPPREGKNSAWKLRRQYTERRQAQKNPGGDKPMDK